VFFYSLLFSSFFSFSFKANDEEGYRKLIDKEKHGRLAHLLEKTDEYMASMNAMISDHQKEELMQEKLAPQHSVSGAAAAAASGGGGGGGGGAAAGAASMSPALDELPTRVKSAVTSTFTEEDLERIAEGEADNTLLASGSSSGQAKTKNRFVDLT
jgi:hypothetical protein